MVQGSMSVRIAFEKTASAERTSGLCERPCVLQVCEPFTRTDPAEAI